MPLLLPIVVGVVGLALCEDLSLRIPPVIVRLALIPVVGIGASALLWRPLLPARSIVVVVCPFLGAILVFVDLRICLMMLRLVIALSVGHKIQILLDAARVLHLLVESLLGGGVGEEGGVGSLGPLLALLLLLVVVSVALLS